MRFSICAIVVCCAYILCLLTTCSITHSHGSARVF